MGWLRIIASPFLVGLGIGALVYYSEPNSTRWIIAVIVTIIGLVIGIILAYRISKGKGVIPFLAKLIATPELDKKEDSTSA